MGLSALRSNTAGHVQPDGRRPLSVDGIKGPLYAADLAHAWIDLRLVPAGACEIAGGRGGQPLRQENSPAVIAICRTAAAAQKTPRFLGLPARLHHHSGPEHPDTGKAAGKVRMAAQHADEGCDRGSFGQRNCRGCGVFFAPKAKVLCQGGGARIRAAARRLVRHIHLR